MLGFLCTLYALHTRYTHVSCDVFIAICISIWPLCGCSTEHSPQTTQNAEVYIACGVCTRVSFRSAVCTVVETLRP